MRNCKCGNEFGCHCHVKPKDESQHSRDLRAERTMLLQTRTLNPEELLDYLHYWNIPKVEYDRIKTKHQRILDAYDKAIQTGTLNEDSTND